MQNLTLLILISDLNSVLPATKYSMERDLTIKIPPRGVPNEGADLEYPISLSLFSYRCEKSVLKLGHWIKVSRTEFEACGQVQPGWGVLQCSGLPLSELSALTTPVASLLLSRKTQIGTRCVTLCHVSFRCAISISVFFLANPPAPSWMEDRREHSRDSVPVWELGGGACEGTLTPTMGGRNSRMSLCFHNSSNISAALYLGKGLQPA